MEGNKLPPCYEACGEQGGGKAGENILGSVRPEIFLEFTLKSCSSTGIGHLSSKCVTLSCTHSSSDIFLQMCFHLKTTVAVTKLMIIMTTTKTKLSA